MPAAATSSSTYLDSYSTASAAGTPPLITYGYLEYFDGQYYPETNIASLTNYPNDAVDEDGTTFFRMDVSTSELTNFFFSLDYGSPINVQVATFTAWDSCQDSCWISVGDDPNVLQNPTCQDKLGSSWGGVKKRCNLTGRYVSFVGFNPSHVNGSGQNYMTIYDIKTWSLPEVLLSQVQNEQQSDCIISQPVLSQGCSSSIIPSIIDLNTSNNCFYWSMYPQLQCDDPMNFPSYDLTFTQALQIQEIYFVVRKNQLQQVIDVSGDSGSCGMLFFNQYEDTFQRLSCNQLTSKLSFTFNNVGFNGMDWTEVIIISGQISCPAATFIDQDFDVTLATTALSSKSVTQYFQEFLDTVGNAFQCGPRLYELVGYTGSFLTLNSGPSTFSLDLLSVSLTDDISSPYMVIFKVSLVNYPQVFLEKNLVVYIDQCQVESFTPIGDMVQVTLKKAPGDAATVFPIILYEQFPACEIPQVQDITTLVLEQYPVLEQDDGQSVDWWTLSGSSMSLQSNDNTLIGSQYFIGQISTFNNGQIEPEGIVLATVTWVDPCELATIIDQDFSVVLTTTALAETQIIQTFTEFLDSVGDEQLCGPRVYELPNCVFHWLSLDIGQFIIVLQSTSLDDSIGSPFYCIFKVSLEQFPLVYLEKILNIIIDPCVPVSYAPDTNFGFTTLTKEINDGATLFPIVNYVITPNCGYPQEDTLLAQQLTPIAGALEPASWFSSDGSSLFVLSSDTTLAGSSYTIQQKSTFNGNIATPVVSATVFWADPCSTATIIDQEFLVVLTTTALAGTQITQTFTEFLDSIGNSLQCGPRVYELVNYTGSYLTLDSASFNIVLQSLLATDSTGSPFSVIFKVSLQNFPAVYLEKTLNIIVEPCVPVSFTQSGAYTGLTKGIGEVATVFPVVTFVQTPACGYPQVDSVLVRQETPVIGSWTTAAFWTLAVSSMLLQSNDSTLSGSSYSLQQYSTFNGISATYEVGSVNWVDPCSTATIIDQVFSVVLTITALSSTSVTQTFAEFLDSVGNSQQCGPRIYELVNQTGTYLTLNAATFSIVLQSMLATDSTGSPFNIIFKVSLLNYPLVLLEKPLNIIIGQCVPISYVPSGNFGFTTLTKGITDAATVIPVVTYVMTPACGYPQIETVLAQQLTPTAGGLAPAAFWTLSGSSITLQSNDIVLAGSSYTIQQQSTFNGNIAPIVTATITWGDPCSTATIIDQVFSVPFTTTALSSTSVTQTFTEFLDSVGNSQQCGPRVYALVNYTGTYLNLNAATFSIVLQSMLATDSTGSPFNVIFKVSLLNYPLVLLEKPLNISVGQCVPITYVPSGNFGFTTLTKGITDAATVIPVVTYVMTPACGYPQIDTVLAQQLTPTADGLAPAAFWTLAGSSMSLQSSDISLVGSSYTIQQQSTFNGIAAPAVAATITWADPCSTATIIDQVFSVVLTTTALSSTSVTQTFTEFLDSVENSQQCGPRVYALVNYTGTYLTLNAATFSIVLQSMLATDSAGSPFSVIFKVSLLNYPLVLLEKPLNIIIGQCVPLTYVPSGNFGFTTLTKGITDAATVIPVVTYVMTPACGYPQIDTVLAQQLTPTADGLAPAAFWTLAGSTMSLQSNDITLAGSSYTVQQQSTFNGIAAPVVTATVTWTDPCSTATIIDQVFSVPLTTTALLQTSITQTFTEFIDSVGNSQQCGSRVYALVNYTGTYLTLNAATFSIVLQSLLATDSTGSPFSVIFKVSLLNYPLVLLEKPLNIIIGQCVPISYVPSGNFGFTTLTKGLIDAATIIPVVSYVMTPACGYTQVDTVLAQKLTPTAGGLAPAAFWTLAGSSMSLQSNDMTLIGSSYKIQQQSTFNGIAAPVVFATVMWVDQCQAATIIDQVFSVVLTTTALSSLSATQVFTEFLDSVGNSQQCGARVYALVNNSGTYLTLNAATFSIVLQSLLATDSIGSPFSVIFKISLLNYPTVFLDKSLNVIIDQCIPISYVPSGNFGFTTKTMMIFDIATVIPVVSYVMTPACGYPQTDTVLAQKLTPTAGGIAPAAFWTLSGSSMSLQSNDITFDGTTFSIKQQSIFNGNTAQIITATVTWVDPCKTTTLISASNIPNSFGLITTPASKVTIVVPWLNDSANTLYRSDSTTFSICGLQQFTITENGVTPQFLTTAVNSAGQTVMEFSTTDVAMALAHQIQISYSLVSYPSVAPVIITFQFTFYNMVVPVPPSPQSYQVLKPPLNIKMGAFSVSPDNPSVTITNTASLSNLAVLPAFIKFTQTGTGSQAMLNFDVNSSDKLSAGTYQILVQGTFSLSPFPSQIQSQTFTLTVTAVTVNLPPVFVTPIGGPFEFKQGMPWSPSYQLPVTLDPEGTAVTIAVNSATANSFLTYNAATNTFIMANTAVANIGTHTISVVLTDADGKFSNYSFQLKITEADAVVVATTVTVTSTTTTTIATTTSASSSPTSNNAVPAVPSTTVLVVYNFDTVTPAVSYANTDSATLINLAADQLKSSATTTTSVTGGFNWMEAFEKVNKAKSNNEQEASNKKPEEPNVSITSITTAGLVTLSFSKAMVVPPLEMIQGATVEVNSISNKKARDLAVKQIVKALQIRAKPGQSTTKENLALAFNITEYAERKMTIQLNFTNAIKVSANDPDTLEAKFVGNFFFFDKDGMVLPKDKTIYKELPLQMQFGSKATAALVAVAEVANTASNGVLASNLFLNIVLSASLQQLWSMVNTQQLVVLMPLWNIKLPANAAMFFGFIMTIAAFDILPTDTFYDTYFPGMAPTSGINANFEAIGFQSMYFNYNIGSMIISYIAFLLLALFSAILKPMRKFKWLNWLYLQITKRIFWNTTIKTITETYTIVVMCVCINTLNPTWASPGEIMASSMTIFFGALIVIFPISLCTYLHKNFELLESEQMKSKIGAIYSELYIKRGRTVIWTLVIFFLRRVMIPISVAYNRAIIVQIFTMTFTVMAQIINVGYLRPFEGGSPVNRIETFNEVMILLIMYTMMCFTDFVPEIETQYKVGYVSCGLVVSHLLINISLMLKTSMKQIIMRIKRWFMIRKYKIAMNKKKKADAARVQPEHDISSHEVRIKGFAQNRIARRRNKLADLTKSQTTISIIENLQDVNESFNNAHFKNKDLLLRDRDDPYSLRAIEREFETLQGVATQLNNRSNQQQIPIEMRNEIDMVAEYVREVDRIQERAIASQEFIARLAKAEARDLQRQNWLNEHFPQE